MEFLAFLGLEWKSKDNREKSSNHFNFGSTGTIDTCDRIMLLQDDSSRVLSWTLALW